MAEDKATLERKAGEIRLIDQWKLALTIASNSQLSRGDVAVAMHIIDRFYKSKGNSRASRELLSDKAGIAQRSVNRTLKRLLAAGYVGVVAKGRRGRATEYAPAFGYGSANCRAGNAAESYGDVDVTETKGDTHVTLTDSEKGDTQVTSNDEYGDTQVTSNDEYGDTQVTPDGNYGDTQVTPTYLPSRPTRTGVQVSRTSSEEGTRGEGAPVAPDGAPDASPRDPKRKGEGFEGLWQIWPNRTQRPKAKDAYRKLAPDQALHEQLVAAAAAWAWHYASNDVAKKWIPRLDTWLSGERWLEDVPDVYEDPKAAAIAKRQANGSAKGHQAPPKVPAGTYQVRIVTSDIHDEKGGKCRLQLDAEILDGEHKGKLISEVVKLGKDYTPDERSDGRDRMSNLGFAFGRLNDSSELLNIETTATWRHSDGQSFIDFAKPKARSA